MKTMNHTKERPGEAINDCRSISELLRFSGLSQSAFARRFDIPLRTVQDWAAGRRTPPDYVIKMAEEILFG